MESLGPAAVRRTHLRFGILCVLGYVALSWAVRFDMRRGEQIASLLYPLDTFSMYAPIPGESMSHLLIRDGQGAIHRVTAFRSFDCAEPAGSLRTEDLVVQMRPAAAPAFFAERADFLSHGHLSAELHCRVE